jgi:hypothetical protein
VNVENEKKSPKGFVFSPPITSPWSLRRDVRLEPPVIQGHIKSGFKNDTQSHQQCMDSPQQLGFDPPSVSMMLARVGLMLIIEAVHMRAGDEPLSNQPPNNKFFSLETL